MGFVREPEAETVTLCAEPNGGAINLAVKLCALAWELHEDGDAQGARDAALDATVIWAVTPSSIDEEVLRELLEDVCGAESEAILRSVSMSPALAAWRS
jgi:hypothetical protein